MIITHSNSSTFVNGIQITMKRHFQICEQIRKLEVFKPSLIKQVEAQSKLEILRNRLINELTQIDMYA